MIAPLQGIVSEVGQAYVEIQQISGSTAAGSVDDDHESEEELPY
jgi:hypothetical protein